MIGYLAIVHLWLLDTIVVGLATAGAVFLVFKAVMHLIREHARTLALLSYHQAQALRNNVVEAKNGVVVLHDPHEAYRVENARDISQTYHLSERQQPVSAAESGREGPQRLSQLLGQEREEPEHAANS
jgi:hypothetical protein